MRSQAELNIVTFPRASIRMMPSTAVSRIARKDEAIIAGESGLARATGLDRHASWRELGPKQETTFVVLIYHPRTRGRAAGRSPRGRDGECCFGNKQE